MLKLFGLPLRALSLIFLLLFVTGGTNAQTATTSGVGIQDPSSDLDRIIRDVTDQLDDFGSGGARYLSSAKTFITVLQKISTFRKRNERIFLVPLPDVDRVQELLILGQQRIEVANLQDELTSSIATMTAEIEGVKLELSNLELSVGRLEDFDANILQRKAMLEAEREQIGRLTARLEGLSERKAQSATSPLDAKKLEDDIDVIAQEIYSTPGTPSFDTMTVTIEELQSFLKDFDFASAETALKNDEVKRANYRLLLDVEPIIRGIQSQSVFGRSELALISNTLDSYTNRLIDIDEGKSNYTSTVTSVFAALVGGVILGFYVLAFNNKEVQAQIFSGDRGIQFITLFSLVIAIILFGILGILEGKELSALLGGLSGYILGRGSNGNTNDDAKPQPPTVTTHPANQPTGAGGAIPVT